GPGEGDSGVGDARLAWVLDTVVVGVHVNGAGKAGRGQLAEVVVGPGDAGAQGDVGELVVGGGPARRANGVLTVIVAGGLGFADRVGPRPQAGKLVGPVGGSGRRAADGMAQVVGAGEGHRDAANAAFAGVLDPVVVGIGV